MNMNQYKSNANSKLRTITIIAMLAATILAVQSFNWLVFIMIFAFYLMLIMVAWAAFHIKFYFNSDLHIKERLFSPSIIIIFTCVFHIFLFFQSCNAIKKDLLIEGEIIQQRCQIENFCPSTPKDYKPTKEDQGEVERELPIWLFKMPYLVRYAKREDHFLLRVFYAPDAAVMVRGGINEKVK